MKTLSLFIVILVLFSSTMFAQVAINADGSVPATSAGLDVNFTDKGLLIPRVSLENTTSASPVTNPAISLLVYNSATTGDVTPGYYFWNGGAWSRLSVFAGGSGTTDYVPKWSSAGSLGNSLIYDNGSNIGIGNTNPGAKLDVAGRIWQTSLGHSILIGEDAGANDDFTNNYNVFIGYKTGYSNISGNDNIAIGEYALYNNTTGYQNIAHGTSSLYSNTTGGHNIAGGAGALVYNTSGSGNIAFGYNSLDNNTTGYHNVGNGWSALNSNTTGHYNTGLGNWANVASGDLINATAIGANAMVGASNSLVLGSIAGVNDATASVKVGIGTTTPSVRLDVVGQVKITDGTHGLSKVLTSDANGLASWQTPLSGWSLLGNTGTVAGTNFIGTMDDNALDIRTNNTLRTRITTKGAIETYNTGQSVFIGEGAGANDLLVDYCNVYVGFQAGYWNTMGMNNTSIGYKALYSNTGDGNNATGYLSLGYNTSGSYNSSNGYAALYVNSTGSFNIANGLHSLFNNTTGSNNTANGYGSLYSNVTGNNNTAYGQQADVASGDLTNATAIGSNAMVSASNSLVLGSIASVNGATESVNVGIGTDSPSARLDVVGQVKITDGTHGLSKVLTSDANGLASWQTPLSGWSLLGNAGTVTGTNFIGTTDDNALDIRTNNTLRTRITTKGAIETYNTGQSVFIGEGAGANDDLDDNVNVFVGYQAGYYNTTGEQNSAIGYQALYSNTEGFNNNANGYQALYSNTEGYYNIANGYQALYSNTDGIENCAFGNLALTYNTNGWLNSAFGDVALYNNTTGMGNTANGVMSLQNNTEGEFNTGMGYLALQNNVSGNYNAALGFRADVSDINLTNATAIGSFAVVNASNSIVLGSIAGVNFATSSVNVGIGTTTPSAKLDVIGQVKITDGTHGLNKVLTSDDNGLASWQTPLSGWSLLGNTGTVAGTNFIGTMDDNALDIRTNSTLRTRITTKGAIETYNTGQSVFIGEGAGANDDLNDRRNVFVGYYAGFSNTTGYLNTANGFYALRNNTTGYWNTANGYSTLYRNTTGGYNTANGVNALDHNTTGENNTANGTDALTANTTGSSNTTIGVYSLYSNTTGNSNTAIGFYADVASGDLTNATAIGSNAMAGSSNSLVLGSIAGVNGATESVNVGIGTTSPSEKLEVAGNIKLNDNLIIMNAGLYNHSAGMIHNSTDDKLLVFNNNGEGNGVFLAENGNTWIAYSDARLKKNIEPVTGILNNVCELSVKRFHYKTDQDTITKRMGFIAQDVQRLFPDLVNTDGEYLALSYSDFGVLSIEAVKELRAEKDAEIAILNQKIIDLRNQNQELKTDNRELGDNMKIMQAQIELINGYLGIALQK